MIVASAGSSVAGTFELPPDSIVDISDSEPARSDSSGEKGFLVFYCLLMGFFNFNFTHTQTLLMIMLLILCNSRFEVLPSSCHSETTALETPRRLASSADSALPAFQVFLHCLVRGPWIGSI